MLVVFFWQDHLLRGDLAFYTIGSTLDDIVYYT